MKTRKQTTPDPSHATTPLTHHGWQLERRAQHGRSKRPECVVVGHAWTIDPAREGWTLCLVCEVIRAP